LKRGGRDRWMKGQGGGSGEGVGDMGDKRGESEGTGTRRWKRG